MLPRTLGLQLFFMKPIINIRSWEVGAHDDDGGGRWEKRL